LTPHHLHGATYAARQATRSEAVRLRAYGPTAHICIGSAAVRRCTQGIRPWRRRAIAQVASSGARQARSISPISRWQLVLDTQIMRDLATASLQLCAERLSFSGEAACVLDTSNALLARNPSMEMCEMPKLCSLPTVYIRISAFQSRPRLPENFRSIAPISYGRLCVPSLT